MPATPTLGSARAWTDASRVPRPGGGPRAGVRGRTGRGAGHRRATSPSRPPRSPQPGPARPRNCWSGSAPGSGCPPGSVLDASHLVPNGPAWVVVRLADAAGVLGLIPAAGALAGLDVGVVGTHPEGHEAAVEVRAFVSDGRTLVEDPVTGSLNAGIGQWLTDLPASYVAAQGTALGRTGRVRMEREGGRVRVGGATTVVLRGSEPRPCRRPGSRRHESCGGGGWGKLGDEGSLHPVGRRPRPRRQLRRRVPAAAHRGRGPPGPHGELLQPHRLRRLARAAHAAAGRGRGHHRRRGARGVPARSTPCSPATRAARASATSSSTPCAGSRPRTRRRSTRATR